MKKIAALMMAALMSVTFMTGCKGDSGKINEKGYFSKLNVYNWGDYIDPEVLKGFEDEYGIKVNYEEYSTNEEMLAKIQAGGTSYDVIFPSEYMIESMAKQKLLQEVDYANVDNFKNIGEQYKNHAYDPNNKFSVPYAWGTMGIVYNKTKVKETVDSWNVLWNSKYKGQILMIDSPRDTIGITLKKLGYSLNTRNPEELKKAEDELMKQKPLVKSYEVDTYKDQMIAEEASMSLAWSMDAMLLIRENPNLAYAIPKEGTNLWFDSMAIPVTSKHKKEAELFINYMLRPEVAMKNAEYIKISTPNVEAMKLLPEDVRTNKYLYPDGDVFKHGEVFTDLGEFTKEYDRMWTEIKSY